MTGTDADGRWLRTGCLGLVLALHALLLGSALRHLPAREMAADAAAATHLVLVDLVPAAVSVPAPAPPERPLPRPRPPHEPVPEPVPVSDLIPATIDASVTQQPDPVQGTSTPPATAADPEPDTASAQSPAATAPDTSTHQALMTWQAQLLAHLQRYRRYPHQAERLRQQGVSHVRFAVDRHGRISQPRIERASGYPLLDAETLATVRRANPVPPPPPEITGNPVDVVVPVSFYLRGSTRRSSVRR